MCCQPGNRRGLSASETDRQRRYSIRMQSRWNYARSAAQPHASSHAQGLEGKKTSSPSSRGRNMSLTSPLIDQALTLIDPEAILVAEGGFLCLRASKAAVLRKSEID